MTESAESEGLFPEPERTEIHPGDMVILRTIWGDEPCVVQKVGLVDGYPMVQVFTESGDRITVNVANVRSAGCSQCSTCLSRVKGTLGLPLTAHQMVLCPDCGNKRCPKATHHDNACSGSNEPGQDGSSYR